MLGPQKTRRLCEPVLASLDARVPQDHFYRHLEARLDLSFVREWVADKYAERGRPSIDPVVFFKFQLILFFEGLRSERKLVETASLHLAHRWYLGYALDEPLPDHSSLTRIRTRLGLPVFTRFFERVVELCQAAGLVWGRELLFDATKVRANADDDSLTPRFYLEAKAHLAQLLAGEPSEQANGASETAPVTGRSPDDSTAPTALPFAGPPDAEERLAEANACRWRLLDEYRLDPARASSNGYQRTSELRLSTTDPDATPMSTGIAPLLGYHDHYVVDGGRARIILSAFVTPMDVMENRPMLDLLRRVQFRYQLHPRRAIADTAYRTAENIKALEDAGIRASVPPPNFSDRTGYYGADRCTYDAELNADRCPQAALLRPTTTAYTRNAVLYQASADACNACPVKAACTEGMQGRVVQRPPDSAYLERVRGYHATEAYQQARRKRQVWVEPLFGEAKAWHHLRKFRLRGLAKVNSEGQLVAAGQNLKRWLRATGWGRRPVPGESLGALVGSPVGFLAAGHTSTGQSDRRSAQPFSTGWAVMGNREVRYRSSLATRRLWPGMVQR